MPRLTTAVKRFRGLSRPGVVRTLGMFLPAPPFDVNRCGHVSRVELRVEPIVAVVDPNARSGRRVIPRQAQAGARVVQRVDLTARNASRMVRHPHSFAPYV